MARKLHNCVYSISFKDSHKRYIGSSKRWPTRRSEHLNDLRKQKHANRYLQRAFNKYGEKNITIEEIEFCETHLELPKAEQKWINRYDSKNPEFGYNLVKNVMGHGSTGYKYTKEQKMVMSKRAKERFKNKDQLDNLSKRIELKLKETNGKAYNGHFNPKKFELYDSKNEKVEIFNLCKFCRDNNLDYGKMYSVASGQLLEYKGWRRNLQKRVEQFKSYELISPDNKLIKIENLAKFCRDNNLPKNSMSSLANGRIKSCKGWTCPNVIREINYTVEMLNGEIINVENLREFAKESGFSYKCICNILHKKTKRNLANIRSITKTKKDMVWLNKEIYNSNGEMYEIDHLTNFCNSHNLNARGILLLFSGEMSHYKGWYTKESKNRVSKLTCRYRLTNTQNETMEIENLAKFCRENGYTTESFRRLMNGFIKKYKDFIAIEKIK